MRNIANRKVVVALLFLQVIPLLLFPPSVYSLQSQEWWLPAFLTLFALISAVSLVRRNQQPWPWYLAGFAQGFNIISRLMMLFPHATRIDNNVEVFNTPYVVLTIVAILMSFFMLSYMERPDVRMAVLKD